MFDMMNVGMMEPTNRKSVSKKMARGLFTLTEEVIDTLELHYQLCSLYNGQCNQTKCQHNLLPF